MDINDINKIADKSRTLLWNHPERLTRIHQFARCSKGPCAELGVCQGGTSKIIAMSTKYDVNIFDTFCGLPPVEKNIDKLPEGEYCSNFDQVKSYLSDCKNIHIFKGLFPDSATKDIEDVKYGFVHLDGDLYSSTLNGLKYFYPKMIEGGVIMTDDWDDHRCPGVNKAFIEYGVPFVNINFGQCIIIK